MQDKKYIVFDHSNPDTLYFVKNIPDDSWIWDSDWIIEDVTDKHGNCLIENNDEYISVDEMGDKTLSDFDKEIIASLKQAIQEDPDEEYLCAYTSEDREFCFEKDELPDDLDSMTPFTDFVENSYVDGDSNSQYQVINLDAEEFGEFGVDIFADEESESDSIENIDQQAMSSLKSIAVARLEHNDNFYVEMLFNHDDKKYHIVIGEFGSSAKKFLTSVDDIEEAEDYFWATQRETHIKPGQHIEEAMTNKEKLMKRFPELNLNEPLKEDSSRVGKTMSIDEIAELCGGYEYVQDIVKETKEGYPGIACDELAEMTYHLCGSDKVSEDAWASLIEYVCSGLEENFESKANANKLNKQEVLDWISEHDLAWEDFVNYFEDIYQSSAEVPIDEIMGWISDHDDLAMDFENKFGISVNADIYDDDCDWFEDELEESLFDNIFKKDKRQFAVLKNSEIANIFETETEAKDLVDRNNSMFSDSEWEFKNIKDLDNNKVKAWLAQDKENSKRYNDFLKQQAKEKKHGKETWVLKDGNSKKVVYKFDTEEALEDFLRKQPQSQQIRLHKDKIYESVEGKWNIGSNKLVSTDSQEYANLVDLAKLLQEKSPNKYQYTVEKTYEDFGANMQWYNIICSNKRGDSWQVLDTREWLDLANGNKSVEEVYQSVVTDRFFQDTVEKGSIFSILDRFQ